MTLTPEQAQAKKDEMIGWVRAQWTNGAPRLSDEQIWQAWRETSHDMANLPENLQRFNPRKTTSPAMVAMHLLCKAIGGEL